MCTCVYVCINVPNFCTYACTYVHVCVCVCVCAYGTLVRSYVYTYFGRYTYVGLKNRRPNEQILQVQLYRC